MAQSIPSMNTTPPPPLAFVAHFVIRSDKTWTADYGLRTGYKTQTRYKTPTGKYGLGIKHGLGIKRGLGIR